MKLIELMKYARVPLELNGKPKDEVLILVDTNTESLVSESLAAAAFEMGMEPNVITMIARPVHGNEPTKVVAEAMKACDLLICANSTAMTHTDAVRSALKLGKKFISMPGITVDMLTRGAATADYQEVEKITRNVAEILTLGNEVRVTSREGTDITFSIKNRPCFSLAGIFHHGTIACFPDGEAAMAPVEGSAQGKILVDVSIHSIGLLEEPLLIKVQNGKAVEITGGRDAIKLKDILSTRGNDDSYFIGEFAVGTNSKARIIGNVSEDKKRIGTVHFGLGDNRTLAGEIRCPTHLDVVISTPTVIVDGRTIVNDGKLTI